MKKRGKAKKLAALLLAACLLVPGTALTASAGDNPDAIAYEDMAQRGENTKVFSRGNNHFVSVTSGTPLHYWKDGRWTEIDNTLEKKKKEDGSSVLINKSNSYQVELPQKLGGEQAVRMSRDGYELSFLLQGVDGVSRAAAVEKQKPQKYASKAEKRAEIEKRSSKVQYKGVEKDTSVQYVVSGDKLKENIILDKAPGQPVSYTYKVGAKELSGQLQKDNSILFKNSKGVPVFKIPTPVMQDKALAQSMDIEVSLTRSGEGEYLLTYTPSMAWLTEAGREYPVKVDPTIVLPDINEGENKSLTQDTYYDSENADINYDESDLLELKSWQGEFSNIYFNPVVAPLLMMKKNVIRSTFKYHQAGYFRFSKDALAGLYKVTALPGEGQVLPPTEANPIDYTKIRGDYMEFDLTQYTRKIMLGDYPINENAGEAASMLMIKVLQGEGKAWFDSANTSETDFAPVYEMEYTYPTGADTGYESFEYDMGQAGFVRLNAFSRFVTIEREELGLKDGKMPVDIRRIFNSGNAAFSIEPSFSYNSRYGEYWMTNYDRRLTYLELGYPVNLKRYVYLDEDGSQIHFEDSGQSADGFRRWTISDAPLGYAKDMVLLIPENQSSTEYSGMVMLDNNQWKLTFNGDGFMTKIQDLEQPGDSIQIVYNGSEIQKIIDGEGREYRFFYEAYSRLSKIACYDKNGTAIKTTNKAGASVPLQVTYEYEFPGTIVKLNAYLTETVYPDGTKITYTMDDGVSQFVGGMTNPANGTTLEINYDPNTAYLARKITMKHNGTIHSSIEIASAGPNQMGFIDENEEVRVVKFDTLGNITHVMDVDGNLLYFRDTGGTVYEPVSGENLLTNEGFETGLTGWQSSGIVMPTGDQAHSGSKSAMLINTAGVSVEQPAQYDQYRLSAYIKTPDGVTDIGATVCVESLSGNGTVIETKTSETVANTNGQWQKVNLDYTMPKDAVSIRAYVKSTGSGIVYADDIVLQEKGVVFGENLVANPDFSAPLNTENQWVVPEGMNISRQSLTGDDSIQILNSRLDENAAMIQGAGTGALPAPAHLSQTVQINGRAGEKFYYGAWVKAYAAALRDNRTLGMRIEAEKADGSGSEVLGEFSFNASNNWWQLGADTFVLPRDVQRVNIYLTYDYQTGNAAFDGVQLCRVLE